jgi:hypothetical protein
MWVALVPSFSTGDGHFSTGDVRGPIDGQFIEVHPQPRRYLLSVAGKGAEQSGALLQGVKSKFGVVDYKRLASVLRGVDHNKGEAWSKAAPDASLLVLDHPFAVDNPELTP